VISEALSTQTKQERLKNKIYESYHKEIRNIKFDTEVNDYDNIKWHKISQNASKYAADTVCMSRNEERTDERV